MRSFRCPRALRALGRSAVPLALAAQCSLGCAHSPEPWRVRYAEMSRGALTGYTGQGPLVVEFEQGDRIPVNLSVDAENFVLEPEHPEMHLVVKRHCFVRFSEDGIQSSADGVTFDARPREPGRFRINFAANRGRETRLEIAIRTPRR